jgi:hypothetical protein
MTIIIRFRMGAATSSTSEENLVPATFHPVDAFVVINTRSYLSQKTFFALKKYLNLLIYNLKELLSNKLFEKTIK